MIEVWGIGNKFRSDDSVALRVCDQLEVDKTNIQIKKYHGDLLNLLNLWNPKASVFIVDAIKANERPGHIHFYGEDELNVVCETSTSTHGLGVAELIEMARTLNLLPAKLFVCGIEPANLELSEKLTLEVEEGMNKLVKLLNEKIKQEVLTYA